MSWKLNERVLICAPSGADSRHTSFLLQREGVSTHECASIQELILAMGEGAGAILIAEEALRGPDLQNFVDQLEDQPSWSDLPVLIVTSGGDTTAASARTAKTLGASANVIFVERPFRTMTLVSTVRSALRSRRRQYEVHDLVQNLEDKVTERTVRLEQTISELEAFSYSVSHDLRAPLRAMQGYSHVLLEDYRSRLDGPGVDYLHRIIAAATRLDQLVQDLLTYSKAARGQFEFEKIDLHTLVRDIVQQYPTFQLPNAEVRIAGHLAPVIGHEASLAQCISNLVGNAVKFKRRDTLPIIDIWTENGNERVKVFVKDNGIGIEPSQHDRIFQMFERGAHPDSYEGTGIGLAIVKKAVERMGGEVGILSNPDAGCTFWFDLPAVPHD